MSVAIQSGWPRTLIVDQRVARWNSGPLSRISGRSSRLARREAPKWTACLIKILQRFQRNFLALLKPRALGTPDHFDRTRLSSLRHLPQKLATPRHKESPQAKLGQDREKHSGFRKDVEPAQRLEGAPNARGAYGIITGRQRANGFAPARSQSGGTSEWPPPKGAHRHEQADLASYFAGISRDASEQFTDCRRPSRRCGDGARASYQTSPHGFGRVRRRDRPLET